MYIVPKDTVLNKETIAAAIKYNDSFRVAYTTLDDYYLGNHAILTRSKVDVLANNRLMINHARYITNINVGYLLGTPVEYVSEQDLGLILEEYKEQSIADIDNEIAKSCSIFGKAYEYIYIAEGENDIRSKVVDVRNCVVIYDNTIEQRKLAAITYSKVGETDANTNITIYTNEKIITYSDVLEITEEKDHFFGAVPVIEYKNNPERIGDFSDVLSLIDAYNVIQSDRVNDKEQLVEALLILYGVTLTPDLLQDVKDNRVLTVPKKTEGTGVEYVTKSLNEADTDILRAKIEADIHKISMTPNMSDENFAGNSSGVALEYKLLPFEWNTKSKERYFERGLKERIRIYNNYFLKYKNMPLVPLHEVDAVFKRNLPKNDLEASQITNNLKGMVDDETLVSQISFVKNAAETIKKAREDALMRAEALSVQFGTPDPLEDNNTDEE